MKIPSDRVIIGENERRWVLEKTIKRHPFPSQTTPILVFGFIGSNLCWNSWCSSQETLNGILGDFFAPLLLFFKLVEVLGAPSHCVSSCTFISLKPQYFKKSSKKLNKRLIKAPILQKNFY